jgi:hypothetical protein
VFLERKGKTNVLDVERAQNKEKKAPSITRQILCKANSQFAFIKSLLWLESV